MKFVSAESQRGDPRLSRNVKLAAFALTLLIWIVVFFV